MAGQQCLVCENDHSYGARGLCNTHYTFAFKIVKTGQTTWEELMELGMALPPLSKYGPRKGKGDNLFMREFIRRKLAKAGISEKDIEALSRAFNKA